MDATQCGRLREACRAVRAHAPRVIVPMGGRDFFSNGIDLNTIEAADSPADESWRNIVAMDDFVLEILNTIARTTCLPSGLESKGARLMPMPHEQPCESQQDEYGHVRLGHDRLNRNAAGGRAGCLPQIAADGLPAERVA